MEKLKVGTIVQFLAPNMKGVIIRYNTNAHGLYSMKDYPYIVQRDDGEVFEYGPTEFVVTGNIVNVPKEAISKPVSMPCSLADVIIPALDQHPELTEELSNLALVLSAAAH